MRGLLYVLALCLVAVVAVWAYRVNYRTLAALDRVETLRAEISAEHEAIGILSVEWAYLNAPARLTRLAQQHLPELGLVPLSPEHFAEVAMVAYPAPPPLVANAAPIEQAEIRAQAEAEAAAKAALAAELAASLSTGLSGGFAGAVPPGMASGLPRGLTVAGVIAAELPEDPASFAETADIATLDDGLVGEVEGDVAPTATMSAAPAEASYASASASAAAMRLPAPRPSQSGGAR